MYCIEISIILKRSHHFNVEFYLHEEMTDKLNAKLVDFHYKMIKIENELCMFVIITSDWRCKEDHEIQRHVFVVQVNMEQATRLLIRHDSHVATKL